MSHYNGCGCGGSCNPCTSHNEIQQVVNDALAFEKENLEQYENNAAQSASDAAKEAAKAAESASAAAQSQTNAETAAGTATQAASSVTNTAVVLEETAERIEQAQDLLEEKISAFQTKPVYFEVSSPTSSLVLPVTETVFNVRSIYVASARQAVGYGFTFDKETRTVTLAEGITADQIAETEEGYILVEVICDVYNSDDPTSFPLILASNAGASNIGTSFGITVEDALNRDAVVYAAEFGVTGDGVECGAAIQTAWNYIATHGGELRFPPGVINFGTTRINIGYSSSLKPHVISGHGDATTFKFDDIPPSGLGPTANWVKETPLIQYVGNNGVSQHIPPVTLRDFCIDYSNQSNKGGTDLSTLAITHPTPYSLGVLAIYFFYGLHPKVENVTFNEIYGDGMIFRKCTMPTVRNNKGYNVSAGNILTRHAPQSMSKDSNGGFIFLWACHGGLVENNLAWNKRTYQASVTSIDNGAQIKDTLCGYIGIWTEYGYDQNMAADGSGETAPPLISAYVSYENVNTSNFNNEALGAVIRNNTVYGYTIGIKSEGLNEAAITQNTVLNCYLPLFASSTRSVIADNWTDMLFCDNITCPQGGYQYIRGNIIAHNYSTVFDGARTGVTIRGNKLYCTNYPGMSLNRPDVTISGNILRFARGVAKPFDISLSSMAKGGIIRDNLFFIDHSVSSISTSNLQYHSGIVFSGNRFINRSAYVATIAFRNTCNDIVLENNTFDGFFFVSVQCRAAVRQNTFDCWTAIDSAYYTGKLLECTNKCDVIGNKFRINSSAVSCQITLQANYCSLEKNTIEVQNTGAVVLNAWVYSTAGNLGLKIKDNQLVSNVGSNPMLYLSNVHFPEIKGNYCDSALISVGGNMYAPVDIGINKCGSLWSATPREYNTAANLSPNITAYVGMKMNYLQPTSGGAEGVVYTASGWKTFGSIASS